MVRELREEIIKTAFIIFKRKGFKLTMDDLAREISISKKTIYNTFRSKDELFMEVVDYFFDKIKQEEKRIFLDNSLPTDEKLRRIMRVLPENYRDLDLGQLCVVKERYPGVYRRIQKRLEIDWENTIYLIQRGEEEGVFRHINITLFKMMFQTFVEQFFQDDILMEQNIEYQDALAEVVGIMVDGVTVRRDSNEPGLSE